MLNDQRSRFLVILGVCHHRPEFVFRICQDTGQSARFELFMLTRLNLQTELQNLPENLRIIFFGLLLKTTCDLGLFRIQTS